MDFKLVKTQLLEILDLKLQNKKIVLNKFRYTNEHAKSLFNYATRSDLTPERINLFKKLLDVVEKNYDPSQTQIPEHVSNEIANLFAQDHLDKIERNK